MCFSKKLSLQYGLERSQSGDWEISSEVKARDKGIKAYHTGRGGWVGGRRMERNEMDG